MRIVFYAPFKPLGHPHPSGDLVIGTGLYHHLLSQGHQVEIASELRARWIYWKPWKVPVWLREQRRLLRKLSRHRPDLWLSYHSYYKAPDILGPSICRQLGLPYAIFQGIYATRPGKNIKTRPGFHLNKQALCAAGQVFTNRQEDLYNLRRLLPESRIAYIPPGIYPEEFPFDPEARARLRREWGVGQAPVILSAAMFRPDVKSQGIAFLLRACGALYRKRTDFRLVIAGDGTQRPRLEALARFELGDRVRFVGKIPREKMHRFYSAGDIFAFPGIRESLGMVFLEAQSCGLPVVAFHNGGIPEVTQPGRTGFLTPVFDIPAFARAIERLLDDPALCRQMGKQAARQVQERHDLGKNYQRMATLLKGLTIKPAPEMRRCRQR